MTNPRQDPQAIDGKRPVVLHLSADYPDPHRGRTTTAIERLLKGVPEAEHIVISLSRSNSPFHTHFIDCGTVDGIRLIAFRYFAPPLGIFLATFMRVAACRILDFLQSEKISPDIIHAHKFGFEGITALWLAERLKPDLKLLVSVRGEADRKTLLFKPSYRSLMRRIASRADVIYHVSAWFKPTMNRLLQIDASKQKLLPNIVANTSPRIATREAVSKFVCILNLDIRRRKGLSDLLKAFAAFHKSHPNVGLDLIGPGSADNIRHVQNEIDQLGLAENVKMLGPMNGQEIFAKLPTYLALVLPSYNETFGMVYVEALFAGIPVLYGKQTGIDGYLEGIGVGVSAKPGNIAEIEAGLVELHRENETFRRSIAGSETELYERFAPERILDRYRADLIAPCAGISERQR